MTENSVRKKAQALELQVAEDISPGFHVGFDKRIPTDVGEILQAYLQERDCILTPCSQQ